MSNRLSICYKGGEARLIEKKSEFIAEIIPVHSEEEAEAFIESVRKRYYDARHHCYAYIIDNGIAKQSDDGEPSQTAGKPMLDVLQGKLLTDVCAVVTRYFGGTLLGTGGLVRAYGGAVKEALNNCVICERIDGTESVYVIDYDMYGRILHLAEGSDFYITDAVFEDRIKVKLLTADENSDKLNERITEMSGGQAVLIENNSKQYIIVDGKVVTL